MNNIINNENYIYTRIYLEIVNIEMPTGNRECDIAHELQSEIDINAYIIKNISIIHTPLIRNYKAFSSFMKCQ